MTGDRALLTFSLGPVQAFIAQARRVADLWAGSDLLSHLTTTAVETLEDRGGILVFPGERSVGFPNRFVADVPLGDATGIAAAMEEAIRVEWDLWVGRTVDLLATCGVSVSRQIWSADSPRGGRQTDGLFETAWSVVPLADYATSAVEGALRFAQSRLFRPFAPVTEGGEKCAVCGERTALPDGERANVRETWEAAVTTAQKKGLGGFLRIDQTRLCLVCATKRLFSALRGQPMRFLSFQDFEPEPSSPNSSDGRFPYFALVALDGDNMGKVLGWVEEIKVGEVRQFHYALSAALGTFADSLRGTAGRGGAERPTQDLSLAALGLPTDLSAPRPQLIYAGGDDVLLVCGVRQALPIALAIRQLYVTRLRAAAVPHLAAPEAANALTTSGAILYAHTHHPAGLLFRDLHDLLSRKAKSEAGRDALALKLAKRGGVPLEVALRWDAGDQPGVADLTDLADNVNAASLSSRQTYLLADEHRLLRDVLGTDLTLWRQWLAERLSRGATPAAQVEGLAAALAPFFVYDRVEALRIARFLASEVPL